MASRETPISSSWYDDSPLRVLRVRRARFQDCTVLKMLMVLILMQLEELLLAIPVGLIEEQRCVPVTVM